MVIDKLSTARLRGSYQHDIHQTKEKQYLIYHQIKAINGTTIPVINTRAIQGYTFLPRVFNNSFANFITQR